MSARIGEAKTPPARQPLLSNVDATLDRFPLMHSVFEQMAAELTQYFGEMSSSPVRVSVERIGADRIDVVQNEFGFCSLGAPSYVTGLASRAAIGVSSGFVLALLNILFGAGRGDSASEGARQGSNIERRIAEFALTRLAMAAQTALLAIAENEFQLGPSEEKLDLSTLGRRSSIAIFCVLTLRANERDSEAVIALPRAALEPFRATLSDSRAHDGSAQDPRWAHKMNDQLGRTMITLRALMEKPDVTLVDIATLDVGSIIELPLSPSDRLKVDCEGQTLFWCSLGQKNGHYTIRIEDLFDERRSLESAAAE